MSDFLNKHSGAQAWLHQAKQRYSNGVFGTLVPAVIWTNASNAAGELLVPLNPVDLVSKINREPFILLKNHDPGCPKGQVLESAIFENEKGEIFVAAILGYFFGGEVLSFSDLDFDLFSPVSSPEKLPLLPKKYWVQLAVDPREVEDAWVEAVSRDAPIEIERTQLSHNAADSEHELIRVGLGYLLLVWNPFVTAIATEAGKATYTAAHAWLRKLFGKLADRRNPILALHSFHGDCQVSFILRGLNVSQHYAAHDLLSSAAVQAAQLVENFKARKIPCRELTYEFDGDAGKWYPSYALLEDGRIVTDSTSLIAIEQLPVGLSLGLSCGQLSPALKSSSEVEGR